MKKKSKTKTGAKAKKNPAAVALGKRARGKPKRVTEAMRQQRQAASLAAAAKRAAREDRDFQLPAGPVTGRESGWPEDEDD